MRFNSGKNTMRKLLGFISILFMLFNPALARAVPIDPATLAKVTASNRTQCVEYYIYKGSLYCSATAHSEQPIDPNLLQQEKMNIVFDNRPWQAAWGKKSEDVRMLEYVPGGENINDWHELITSQFFPGLQEKVTAKQFAELFIQDLQRAGFKPIVQFLEEKNNLVIFEFRLAEPANQIQDEIQKVTTDNKGLYSLHYVIKNADMGPKNREKWLHNLQNSSIK